MVAQGQSHCASNIISNSHSFHSKWVDPPIPELQQFQYLAFKIQGQGHGWGQSLKSQYEFNILLTNIPFIPCQWAIPFLRYDFFNIWHWKSKVKIMGEVNIESHNMGPTFYRLPSLWLHVNRPSHSWDTSFSKFDLENPRSRSWLRSKLKVIKLVQHPIDSYPVRSMSIGHPIPEIQHFQNSTLKIQGQGHGWGGHCKSQNGSNILSTHIPLIPCQSAIPFVIWLFPNLTLKIQGQGHEWGEHWKSQSGCNIQLTHIPFVPCQSALPFLRYSIFKIWPSKSKVKVEWAWCCTTTGLDNSRKLEMV